MKEEPEVPLKDKILEILANGATTVSSVEGILHGAERRRVRDVIRAHPDLFKLFERGFPESGPRSLWVRLRRTDPPERDDPGSRPS